MPIATMWAHLATGGLPDELTYPLLIRIRSSLSRLVNLSVEKPILRSGLPDCRIAHRLAKRGAPAIRQGRSLPPKLRFLLSMETAAATFLKRRRFVSGA